MNTQLILSMYKNGIGIKKISAILNISYLDVYHTLDRKNIWMIETKYVDRNNKIKDLYMNGNSITTIADKLKIDRHTVTNVLREFEIYKGNLHASNFSKEKKERNDKIISMYNSGKKPKEISKDVGVSKSTIHVVLKTFNIKMHPQHEKGHSSGTTKNRKHFFDFDFFAKIDSEEKAYWLGFLYADGYNSYNGQIRLCLAQKDKCHVEKFRNSIKAFDTDIKYSKLTKSYSIVIRSIKMANDLTKLGCMQKKSLILEFPSTEQVPKKLIHHFMRGYFDGDGCICYPNNFSILGTPKFLDKFETILIENINHLKKNKRIHSPQWNINTEEIAWGSKSKVKEIYKFLYKDSTIFLSRKNKRFIELIGRPEIKSLESLDHDDGIKLENRKTSF